MKEEENVKGQLAHQEEQVKKLGYKEDELNEDSRKLEEVITTLGDMEENPQKGLGN